MKENKYYTYIMVKPGFADNKKIVKFVRNTILDLREDALPGLKITEESYINYNQEAVNLHYAEHIGQPYFEGLVDYIMSGKAYGMVFESSNPNMKIVIRALAKELRTIVPEKFGVEATKQRNVVHASDEKPNSEKNEIKAFKTLLDVKVNSK